MREISLGGGRFAIVDDDDYDALSRLPWHYSGGYVLRSLPCVPGRSQPGISMHRQIVGASSDQHVDHRDGNGLNNQRSNLRTATRRQNMWNRRKRKGSSQWKGVCWMASSGKWVAQIRHPSLVGTKRPQRYLGLFVDEVEAARAYDAAAREAFGEFAALNFPLPGEQSAHT